MALGKVFVSIIVSDTLSSSGVVPKVNSHPALLGAIKERLNYSSARVRSGQGIRWAFMTITFVQVSFVRQVN